MKNKMLIDNKGRVIGQLVEQPNRTLLLNGSGKPLGWYDKHQDKTFTVNGQLVGTGNQLGRLSN